MVTTIQLEPETRERLKRLGEKGETYNEIILRLISVYEGRIAELEQRLNASRKEFVPYQRLRNRWGIK
jgi:predicted DNA-binding protein